MNSDPSLPSPRYADCVGINTNECVYGPYGNNCISQELNNAAPSNTSNGTICDEFAVNKEANLGSKCLVNDSYFWTAMLKNGNYIASSNLCGPPYPPQPHNQFGETRTLKFNELPMNQPLVLHSYTNNESNGYFEGTWDLNASKDLINPTSNLSYFKFQWRYDEATGKGTAHCHDILHLYCIGDPVFKNTIKTSKYYPWLMLYTGVDVGKGEKGGVQYIGRGMMKYAASTSVDFIVEFNLTINTAYQAKAHSSFYFLNMGACWKNNNGNLEDVQCDGNTTTDVTRYVLMETNPEYMGNCNANNRMNCPRYHTFVNGTVVSRNDTNSYPYDAYKYWCVPWNCDDVLPGEPGCDEMSNPMAQNILKIAPHPEWAYHGFPSADGEGYYGGDQTFWSLHAGELLNRLYYPCTDKELKTNWTTFNIGPEAGIGSWNGYSVMYEWDVSLFDVLVPSA